MGKYHHGTRASLIRESMIFAPCATIFSIQPANQTPFQTRTNHFPQRFRGVVLRFHAPFRPIRRSLLSNRPTPSSILSLLAFLPNSALLLLRYFRDIYEKRDGSSISLDVFLTRRRNRVEIKKNWEKLGNEKEKGDSRVSRGEDRTNERNPKEGNPETKGKRLSVFLSPPSSFVSSNPRLSPENRRVFAMSSHPFRVRTTRNTRINMKFHRRNTAALSLSLFRGEGRKEEAARHRWWLCILAGGRGKIPWFTKNRAGGMAIEVENEREREREERNLDSSFRTLHSRRARSIVGIYISIRDSCRLIPPPPVFGEYNSQDRCKSIATPSRFCFSNASISYNFEIRPPRTRNGME